MDWTGLDLQKQKSKAFPCSVYPSSDLAAIGSGFLLDCKLEKIFYSLIDPHSMLWWDIWICEMGVIGLAEGGGGGTMGYNFNIWVILFLFEAV